MGGSGRPRGRPTLGAPRPGRGSPRSRHPLTSPELSAPALEDVVLYTDGACSGNPGPGGWAALIIDGGQERVLSGAEASTTNQRMELTAAVEGLAAIPGRRRVHLHSDSAYIVNCFRDRWYERWERNGWIGSNRQPVANRDLWERLLAETRRHEVVWHKVAGHAGDPLNERVDRLARAAIASITRRG
jgi:ribonuclease HI